MGVDTPKTVFVDSAEDLERGVEEIGFPCIFKPVESLAFKTRFRRHVLEIGSADGAARGLRQGGRLRHAHAAGHRAGRRRGAVHARLVPRRAEPAARRSSPATSCASTRRGSATSSMAVSKWVPELAEAGLRLLHELGYHGVSQVEFKRDPRDGALPPHGGQRASLDVALARHRLRRQPLARRLPRRDRRAVHLRPPGRRRSNGSSRSPTRATRSRAGAGATRSSGRGSRATAACASTACTRCATRSPARC